MIKRTVAVLILGGGLIAACSSPVTVASPSPTSSPAITTAPPTPTVTTGVTKDPPPIVTLNPAVSVCGSLVRWASDGNTQLARIDVGGAVTEYRLQVGYGSASPESATGIPYLVRLTGRQVPADSGSAQAINLVDYNLTRVTACG